MPTTYRKTAKGVDEVQTRAHRLTPRARNTLILVDGARSDEDLAKLIQVQPMETLQALLDGGFIEAVAASGAPAPLPPPDAATAPTPAAASAAARPVDFKVVQREAVRLLIIQAGPAADDLAMRIESARDLAQLRPLLVHARSLIGNLRGAQAAEDYINALSTLK